MREWFIAGCKLLGVYLLYSAIITIVDYVLVYFSEPQDMGKTILLYATITSIVNAVLQVLFALFLLIKSEWLADKVKLAEVLHATASPMSRPALRFGMILIGVYVFLTHIGWLISTVWKDQLSFGRNYQGANPFTGTEPSGLIFKPDMIKPLAPLLLSLALIFASGRLAGLLMGRGADSDPLK